MIQNHHNDLQQVIINPLDVGSKLLQEGVVGNTLVSEVNTLVKESNPEQHRL